MKYIDGAPAITICASDETSWVIYTDGYITFGNFADEETCSERLSHLVDWIGGETYPKTEEEVVEVMTRALDSGGIRDQD